MNETPDWFVGPLPEGIGLPDPAVVAEDNDHDTDWELVDSGDQGPEVEEIDRYFVRYRSARGWLADYFYFEGYWSLGAN